MLAPDDKPWRVVDGVLRLRVRITPKAGKDAIDRMLETGEGAALRARVRAAPEGGNANSALETLVARWLGIPRTAVSISSGTKSRIKTLALTGDPAALESVLSEKVRTLEE